eukprot:TRINITY_DN9857_c0_g1_i1.p1 TRINITY_DN9857_c0_g1~~TRINITY_DN9857_c0_g1_i1.p1  ORF type:complete len:588 (-),score=125.99 TRINITY_DN9857_c0_g1_i1:60-1823(-)
MAKGDDTIARKRNKIRRKKSMQEGTKTSSYIRAIIAAKQRRKAGKRRICEGMCFTLPTPENPFNDPIEPMKPERKNHRSCDSLVKKLSSESKRQFSKRNIKSEIDKLSRKKQRLGNALVGEMETKSPNTKLTKANTVHGQAHSLCSLKKISNEENCPVMPIMFPASSTNNIYFSKSIVTREEALKLALHLLNQLNLEKAEFQENISRLSFDDRWTKSFMEAIFEGKSILGSCQPSFDVRQTILMAAAAAAHIASKQNTGGATHGAMVLILVDCQQEAQKVRNIFKHLKILLGIHSVSLHPGTSLGHQVEGLSLGAPEILISTPKRLSELIQLKALDISHVSFLVIDGLSKLLEELSVNVIKSLWNYIVGTPQVIIFSDRYAGDSLMLAQVLLEDPVQRILDDSSDPIEIACVAQSVSVLLSEEKKMQKVVKILGELEGKQQCDFPGKVAILVDNLHKMQDLSDLLESKGYFVLSGTDNSETRDNNYQEREKSKERIPVKITRESLLDKDTLQNIQVLILYNFPSSIDTYRKLLTGMSYHSARGILYSFLSGKDALISASLIALLQQGSQPVPKPLQMMADAASILHE